MIKCLSVIIYFVISPLSLNKFIRWYIPEILDYYINRELQEPFAQLLTGLKTLGLLDINQTYPLALKNLFIKKFIKLTAERMRSIMKVHWNAAPEEVKKEEAVMTNLYYLLSDLERKYLKQIGGKKNSFWHMKCFIFLLVLRK